MGWGSRERSDKQSDSGFNLKVEPTGFPDSWWMEEKEEARFLAGQRKDGAVSSCGGSRAPCCHTESETCKRDLCQLLAERGGGSRGWPGCGRSCCDQVDACGPGGEAFPVAPQLGRCPACRGLAPGPHLQPRPRGFLSSVPKPVFALAQDLQETGP